MKPKITIKDLSEALDLSISTVSKSLSNSHEISVKTKKRVQEYAQNCNYRPNKLASSFRRGNTKTIGVIIPNIMNPFFALVLLGIEKKLALKDYKIITALSNESIIKESNCMELMSGGYVDGLILCLSKETQIKNRLEHFINVIEEGLPIVLFDRINHDILCDKVVNNDFQISYDATEFLIKNRSCKKIAVVSSINNLSHGKLRVDGFKSALQRNNITYNHDFVIESTNIKSFNKKIKNLLQNGEIDGIFGVNEGAIMNTIHIGRSLGYDISKDLSIAAFCSQSQKAYFPSLAIVDQHAEKIGDTTAQIILDRIEKTRKRRFKTTIVKASLG